MSVSHLKLKTKYTKEVVPKLIAKFGVKSMAVPKIKTVFINAGLGKKFLSTEQGKVRTELITRIKEDMKLITGQNPMETKAKKSIAGFKSREGMVIGLKTTLRGQKMYDFLDKIISYVLPRVRDFRGLSIKSIDGQGNLNIGIKDMMVFPEVPPASSRDSFGLQVTIVVSSNDREQAKELFYALGFPLQKETK